jgi:hypothetical protein
MEVEGYTYDESVGHFLDCSHSHPGTYDLTIEGSSIPITDPQGPGNLWSEMQVFLSSDPVHPVASLKIASETHRKFTISFVALKPFDSILLKTSIKGSENGVMPVWLTNFKPDSFGKQGQQYVRLRSVKLMREEMQSSLPRVNPNRRKAS